MTNEEYHKKLSETINKNRTRILKLKKAIANGNLEKNIELKYRHAIIRLTAHVKAAVREETRLFGGPY